MIDTSRNYTEGTEYQLKIEKEVLTRYSEVKHYDIYLEKLGVGKFREMLLARGMTFPMVNIKQPDIVIFDNLGKIMRVIEVKHRRDGSSGGSVDEKFETAKFKWEYWNRVALSTKEWTASFNYVANSNYNVNYVNEVLEQQNIKIKYMF